METKTMPPLTVADVKLEGAARALADKTARAGLIDCGMPLADVADDVLSVLARAFPGLAEETREKIARCALIDADAGVIRDAQLRPVQVHHRDAMIARHDRS